MSMSHTQILGMPALRRDMSPNPPPRARTREPWEIGNMLLLLAIVAWIGTMCTAVVYVLKARPTVYSHRGTFKSRRLHSTTTFSKVVGL